MTTKSIMALMMILIVGLTSSAYAQQPDGKGSPTQRLLEEHIAEFHVWTEAWVKKIDSIVFDVTNHGILIDNLGSQVQTHELWFDTYDTREAIQDTRIGALETGFDSLELRATNIESGTILFQKQTDDLKDRIHELEEHVSSLEKRIQVLENSEQKP